MFRVRVLATEEEIALITQAARKLGLSAPQFVTRLVKRLTRTLQTPKTRRRSATSPRRTKSLRKKPKS